MNVYIHIQTPSKDDCIYYAKDRVAVFYISFSCFYFNCIKDLQEQCIKVNNIDITQKCRSSGLYSYSDYIITCYLDLPSILNKKDYDLINSKITIEYGCEYTIKSKIFDIKRGTEYPLDL